MKQVWRRVSWNFHTSIGFWCILMPWFGDVVLLPFRLLILVLEGDFVCFGKSRTPKTSYPEYCIARFVFWVDLLWTLFAKADFLLTQGFEDLYKILDTVHQESRRQNPLKFAEFEFKELPFTPCRGVCSLQILDSNDMIHLRICSTLSLHGFSECWR